MILLPFSLTHDFTNTWSLVLNNIGGCAMLSYTGIIRYTDRTKKCIYKPCSIKQNNILTYWQVACVFSLSPLVVKGLKRYACAHWVPKEKTRRCRYDSFYHFFADWRLSSHTSSMRTLLVYRIPCLSVSFLGDASNLRSCIF